MLDVRALLSRIEGIDETKEKTKGEATSNSLASKKEDGVLEKQEINNADIEKILVLVQLIGTVKEVEPLLKYLIVVLVFFGIILIAKN